MPLLRLDKAFVHYGTLVLLDELDLTISRGSRIGLLGRNGAGKTTFLKVLSGELPPESGVRWLRPGVRIAWLRQDLPPARNQTVYDVVASGLAETGRLLAEYHRLLRAGENADMTALSRVQQRLEAQDGWTLQQRVETTISQLQLPGEARMVELSGGWLRRVALARALVSDPDILLLDEPTNHLDIPAIEWLEAQLRDFQGALVLITHDRRFLRNVVNSIAELDRGQLTLWPGDYAGFLRHRDRQLQSEEKARHLFDRKLAQEEVWIRQGIKARRTRNEGRVRALERMREEHSQRRERPGGASFSLDNASKSGKIVAELRRVGHSFGDRKTIDDFSTVIQRGDRIGIVGANGAGKSTLVRILLGELQPDSGQVKLGSKLDIAYSDQLRDQLEPEKDLIDNVCGGREFIEIEGRRRHAVSYLGKFLFSPQRINMPVKSLSGGEQNRAVLARLFSKPANLLVLDEPTNDLDIETLELLEEVLLEFDGTVLLVSHDREFMDRVVTRLIVLDGLGGVSEHAGGYADWEARGGTLSPPEKRPAEKAVNQPGRSRSDDGASKARDKRRLSYKEQRELKGLPAIIEALERQQSQLAAQVSAAEFYESDYREVEAVLNELARVQKRLESAFERWHSLEERR
jgi:ATP-binding cassette subfamily F protein uup